MTISEHILQQTAGRQPILNDIHELILKNDPNVEPTVGKMMGKEMIIYNQRGFFKYALASVKDHISLHVLPIYMNTALHSKYQELIPDGQFQKGCINFKDITAIPLDTIGSLLLETAPIDLLAIREKQLADKKKKK